MTTIELKEQLKQNVEDLPKKYLLEVFDFVEFLKLHEDKWFIDYVNKKTQSALMDRKKGKNFYTLKQLQKDY